MSDILRNAIISIQLGVEDFNSNGKMQALHSSSAIVVNVFEYWKSKSPDFIAKALKIPSKKIEEIVFEEKFPIVKDFINHFNLFVM